MASINAFNMKLAEISSNGKGEAGLEIGADPGLATEEYIQIPKSMIKHCCARIDTGSWSIDHPGQKFRNVIQYDENQDRAHYINQPGWVAAGEITIVNGKLSTLYTVDVGHVRDIDFEQETLLWIHALRFWAVVAGFVTTTKLYDYRIVNDPVEVLTDSDIFVEFAINYSANALTASAARATSWRRSNHATGGDSAVGFPRRWFQKKDI